MRLVNSTELVPGNIYYINKIYPGSGLNDRFQGIFVNHGENTPPLINEVARFSHVKKFGHPTLNFTLALHTFFLPSNENDENISTMTQIQPDQLVVGTTYFINRTGPRPAIYKGVYVGTEQNTMGKLLYTVYIFTNIITISPVDFMSATPHVTFFIPEKDEIEQRARDRLYGTAINSKLVSITGDEYFDSGFGSKRGPGIGGGKRKRAHHTRNRKNTRNTRNTMNRKNTKNTRNKKRKNATKNKRVNRY